MPHLPDEVEGRSVLHTARGVHELTLGVDVTAGLTRQTAEVHKGGLYHGAGHPGEGGRVRPLLGMGPLRGQGQGQGHGRDGHKHRTPCGTGQNSMHGDVGE